MKKIVLLLLLLSALNFSINGQENNVNLKDKRLTLQVEKKPSALVFTYLMENYDLLIGFEQSLIDDSHSDYIFETNVPKKGKQKLISKDGNLEVEIESQYFYESTINSVTIHAVNEKLEDVFDKIVMQMKNYKWEIKDGVINIFPDKGRDPKLKELLETKIKQFTLERGKKVKAITDKIKSLPEVQKFLKENNLFYSGIRVGPKSILVTQYGKTINVGMNFSNITFKQLLNKITRIKRGGWIIKNSGFSETKQKKQIDVDI